MHKSRILITAALAFASLGAVAAPAVQEAAMSQKAVMTQSASRYEFRREHLWSGGGFGRSGRRAAYGWTNAHQKRVARKKRNQARHRRACRG